MDFGFIFTRHVNDNRTNLYWIECYNCIRNVYGNEVKIIIIDDHSNYRFITPYKTINCEIINSEFYGTGELLSYYYFFLFKFFNKAIIIHDSTFIKAKININEDIKFLWDFTHEWDNDNETIGLIINSGLNEKWDIIDFYNNKELWKGCFGIQSIISLGFLNKLQERFNIFSLIDKVNKRNKRCFCERIFAVLVCMIEKKNISLFGDIHKYINWKYTFEKYIIEKDKEDYIYKNKQIIKVWTGR